MSSSSNSQTASAQATLSLLKVAHQMLQANGPELKQLLEQMNGEEEEEEIHALVSSLHDLLKDEGQSCGLSSTSRAAGSTLDGNGYEAHLHHSPLPPSASTNSPAGGTPQYTRRTSLNSSSSSRTSSGITSSGTSITNSLGTKGICHGLINKEDSILQVLNDQALLQEMFSYIVEPRATARLQLGLLARVSKFWKELATSDVFWRPVSVDLFPALPDGGGVGAAAGAGEGGLSITYAPVPAAATTGGEEMHHHHAPHSDTSTSSSSSSSSSSLSSATSSLSDTVHHHGPPAAAAASAGAILSSYHQHQQAVALRTNCREQVMRFGKALGEPRYRTTSAWQEDLCMVYEVSDANDGRRLFYGTGPIHVAVGQNVILRLAGAGRHEVSEPFSAADRDPGLERFATVRDFFKACHGPQYPASLRVRVVICDQTTGRMALLYHSGKSSKRHAKVPNASYWQDFLPEDSLYIWDADSVFFGAEGQVKLAAAFYVVAAQGGAGHDEAVDDIDEKDRLYRIAGGDIERYGLHSSYVSLDFSTTDGEAVGRFIKSLLA